MEYYTTYDFLMELKKIWNSKDISDDFKKIMLKLVVGSKGDRMVEDIVKDNTTREE